MSLRSSIARLPGARRVWQQANALLQRMSALRTRVRPESVAAEDSPPNLRVRLDLWMLALANRVSFRSVTNGTSDTVVTMTTHGSRIATVYLALESIARGTRRPARLILWLDDPDLMRTLPPELRRLQRRGLEVILAPAGYKVHTKYHFYVTSIDRHSRSLVTSDDDIVYPRTWLAGLEEAHARHPELVVCYRAHTITPADGALAPYSSWTPCASTRPSFRTFGTSVSGQLFPASFLDYVRDAGEAFLELAPNADDVWLHCLTVRAGIRVAQIDETPVLFPFVPTSQATGLYLTNYWDGGNDRQITATYSSSEIARISHDGDSAP